MRLPSIEVGRVIALLGVVFIHVNSLGAFGNDLAAGFFLDEISRFAVPLFFLISGYFLHDELLANPLPGLRRLFERLAPPMAFWTIFYFILDKLGLLYGSQFQGGLRAYLAIPMTGGAGHHLWFLPALFVGIFLCTYGVKVMGLGRFFVVSVVLYICGIALGAFQKQFFVDPIQNVFYRNGIFFAPLFLMIGYGIRKKDLKISSLNALLLASTGAIIHLAEGYITMRYPRGHDFSFGTILFSCGLFLFLITQRYHRTQFSDLGKSVFGAYLMHLWVLTLLLHFIPWKNVFVAVAVALTTWLSCLLVSRLLRHNRFFRTVL
jgi:surface polysaccharide O-acyltransferase-like enzyme